MSLHDRFTDEAEFREVYLKPLLNRLGFYGVAHHHGATEFGKDFVFSELHRLGGMRHYAAVVKHAEKINQGRAVDEVLTQVKQCFTIPFKRADSPRECHVSSVYVFNSGVITANAREQIAGALVRESFGDNVHFLDGERLRALNDHVTFDTDREIRQRIMGFRAQLELNRSILDRLLSWDDSRAVTPDARGFIWSALEAYVTVPVSPDAVDLNLLYRLWQRLRTIDTCRVRLGDRIIRNDLRAQEITLMHQLCRDAGEEIKQADAQLKRLLEKFVSLL